jgi:hypothetical protein
LVREKKKKNLPPNSGRYSKEGLEAEKQELGHGKQRRATMQYTWGFLGQIPFLESAQSSPDGYF